MEQELQCDDREHWHSPVRPAGGHQRTGAEGDLKRGTVDDVVVATNTERRDMKEKESGCEHHHQADSYEVGPDDQQPSTNEPEALRGGSARPALIVLDRSPTSEIFDQHR